MHKSFFELYTRQPLRIFYSDEELKQYFPRQLNFKKSGRENADLVLDKEIGETLTVSNPQGETFTIHGYNNLIPFLMNIQNSQKTLSELDELKDKIKKSQKNFSKSKANLTFLKENRDNLQNIVISLIQSENLQDIPARLMKLNVFNHYSSFLLLSLQKGISNAHVYDHNKRRRLKSYFIKSSDFNSIFNSIKKSKTDYFYEHKIITPNLKLVGSYLANTFTLNTHQVILIISRDDFITPEENEVTTFKEFCNHIEKALNYIESKNTTQNTFLTLMDSLKKTGYQIEIIDTNKKDVPLNLQDSHKVFLTKNKNFKLHYDSEGYRDKPVDVFHYQRIKLMGELFNILKHELSNPLFGIKMALDILLIKYSKSSFYELFKQIIESANRSLEILNNMTDTFSLQQKISVLSIEKIIDRTYTILKSELRQVNFTATIPEDLKSIKIQTNISVLIQILFNLTINAIQELKSAYQDLKLAKIQLSVEKSLDGIKIFVEDNGRGIPATIAESLFTPFVSSKPQGNGLGLAISKGLAQKLGGNLELTFSQNGQTIFCLTLPKETIITADE
ncbi:MAG: hypothetical protein H6621_06145 [Halobacteriovoraceae bacterium]|nr:hypothetical protein [Halobacteriovoraceae bacterium]